MKKIQFSFELVTIMLTNQTGLYFNPLDIRLSYMLNREIGGNCTNEDIIDKLHFKYFKKVNNKEVYKQNFNKNCVVDRLFFSNDSCVVCDICEQNISVKTRAYFYSNPNGRHM